MSEYFYTFLKPIFIPGDGLTNYFVYGYREVDGEVVSFSATKSEYTPWTLSESYTDQDLIEKLKSKLPPTVKRRKRKEK